MPALENAHFLKKFKLYFQVFFFSLTTTLWIFDSPPMSIENYAIDIDFMKIKSKKHLKNLSILLSGSIFTLKKLIQ